jgi:hypothetical protein
MDTKFSNVMIGIVVLSSIVALLVVIISNFSTTYNTDNMNLSSYNKMKQITLNTEEISSEIDTLEPDSSVFDKIGAYFSAGYKSLLLVKDSSAVAIDIANEGMSNTNIGYSSPILKSLFITIIIIVIFIMILMGIILKGNI